MGGDESNHTPFSTVQNKKQQHSRTTDLSQIQKAVDDLASIPRRLTQTVRLSRRSQQQRFDLPPLCIRYIGGILATRRTYHTSLSVQILCET